MDETLAEEIRRSLNAAASSAGLSLALHPVEPRSEEIAGAVVYQLSLGASIVYVLPNLGSGRGSAEVAGASALGSSDDWLHALGATEAPLPASGAMEEYLAARAREDGQTLSYTLTPLASGEGVEPPAAAAGIVIAVTLKAATRSESPADLLAGRALLDEGSLEKCTGMSWLLVRCERIGFASAGEVKKLLGEEPRHTECYEKASTPLLGKESLRSISKSGAARLERACPGLGDERGETDPRKGYLLLLYRVTRGEAVGALRSSRLIYAAPLKGIVRPRREGLRDLLLKLLELQVEVDSEAGISWLRLLAPRRYQYLRPSPSALYLYRTLVTLGREGFQRAFQELRRDRKAFRSLGQILAVAPHFDVAGLYGALSQRQQELLLPRRVPGMAAYAERLTTLLDALRNIERYAEENPSTAARPGMELFQKLARERFRRLRARVDASVTAGIYSLLFEHARLGWLQRAWSRLDRREMVRALAFEPPRVMERAGMLYSRRGRLFLREDAEALARRAAEWDPSEIVQILRARRSLWPVLMEQLFDAESSERYVSALTERAEGRGLPAAVAALTLLRLEEVRPGILGSVGRISAAARVASEPALDEESESHLLALLEEPRLLGQGGNRFVWLVAHALERMGRPEAAAEVLELLLRQLQGKGDALPPDEQRRAKRLGQKYRELTS